MAFFDPAPAIRIVAGEKAGRGVEAALVRTLYRQIMPILAGNLTVAVVLVAVLWDSVDRQALTYWASAIIAATLGRFAIYVQFQRARPPDSAMKAWGRLFVTGAAVNGAIWGLTGIVLYVPGLMIDQIVIAAVVVGMSAGALAASSAHLPAFFAFIAPALLPGGLLQVTTGSGLQIATGGLMLLFALLISWIAINLHVSIRETLSLRVERGGLLDELRRARDAAESASRAKSAFLANISHELRTPLNAIAGFSQIMSDQMFGRLGDERYVQYAALIHESGQHLLQLIEDILDLSKIESGSVELREQTFDAGAAIAVSAGLLTERARSGGVNLYVRIPPDLPMLHADEGRLRQIVLNLVANAVKFTPRGGSVIVAVSQRDGGDFMLKVSDTGIGIAADDLPLVMSPFVQGAESHENNLEGTGLGLPLVKLLVDLHQGTLQIESEPGEGTIATVVLPVERVVTADRRRSA